MKYFTITHPGHIDDLDGELLFTSVRRLREYLKKLSPMIYPQTKIYRHWWSGDDYVECAEYTVEEILNQKAHVLKAGQTAQWAYDHHTI